jgi:hypothetical protein
MSIQQDAPPNAGSANGGQPDAAVQGRWSLRGWSQRRVPRLMARSWSVNRLRSDCGVWEAEESREAGEGRQGQWAAREGQNPEKP